MFRRKSILFLYVLIFAVFTNLSTLTVERFGIPLLPILFALVTGVLLYNVLLEESYPLTNYRDSGAYLINFFFLIFLTLGLINANVNNALHEIYLLLTGYFVFHLILWYVRSREELDGVLMIILISGILLALHGSLQFLREISEGVSNTGSIRAMGMWDNPNVFAFIMNLTYLISFYFIEKEQKVLRLMSCFAQLSSVVGVLLSVSRGGILVWFLITTMNWQSLWRHRKFYLAMMTLVAVFFSIMVGINTLNLETIQRINIERLIWDSDENRDDFSNGRLEAALGGLAVYAQHPVAGVGFGNMLDYAELVNHIKLYSHNIYIDILAVSGPLPLVCYLLMLEYLLLGIVKDKGVNFSAARILTQFIIVLAIMGLFSHTLLYMKPVWVLLALYPACKAAGRAC